MWLERNMDTSEVRKPHDTKVNESYNDRKERAIKFMESRVQDWTASKWEQAWLKSYRAYPMAEDALHYYRQKEWDWSTLTKWEEAYLKSHENDSYAPSAIHYIAKLRADGEKITTEQMELEERYKNSKKWEKKPEIKFFP